MRPLKGIILHCADTRPSWMAGSPLARKIAEIRRWHVQDRGWSDIGYHYVVDRDGKWAPARPIERVGAHTQGHNTGTIGVCLLGGYGSAADDEFSENFTPEQQKTTLEIISLLRSRYGNLTLAGHNNFAAKACPGFNVGKWFAAATK